VHFWDPAVLHYPWLDDVPGLGRPFLPSDYRPVSPDVNGVVFVEANCLPNEGAREVAFVEQLAAAEPSIIGTVAFVDLLDEPPRRAALERLAQTPQVVGVRHNVQGHAPGFCTQPAFVRGVLEVGQLGLVFDVCATAAQIGEVTELVRRSPSTQFVLDHCGKPAIRDKSFEPWAADIARLAELENISCKLSGLLTEARPDQRNYESLLPYADRILACFGPSRMLFGSDWPVATLAGGYRAWREFTDRFASTWSVADRQRFYAGNAIHLYGLDLHALR